MMQTGPVKGYGVTLLVMFIIMQVSLSACASTGSTRMAEGTDTPSAIRLPPQWTETPWPGPTDEAYEGAVEEWAACPDDPAFPLSSLHAGNTAEVTSDSVRSLQLRDIAGWVGSTEVAAVQPGEQVEILEGPVCMDQFIWWRVRSILSGAEGWVIEGNQYDSWLVPSQ